MPLLMRMAALKVEMPKQPTLQSLMDARVRIGGLPADGRKLTLKGDDELNPMLAERLDILAVDDFAADLLARPLRGGIQVIGKVRATVQQACVVTLVPVTQTLKANVDRVFMPGKDPHADKTADLYFDAEGEDEPDYFEGDYADLTELVVETLALALDPYPRAPGVEFEPGRDGDDDPAKSSPFAALSALKPDKDKS